MQGSILLSAAIYIFSATALDALKPAIIRNGLENQIGVPIDEIEPPYLKELQPALPCDPWKSSTCSVNNRPIIGILAQELEVQDAFYVRDETNTTSYIAASYVKWVESAGARVVPILINQPDSYYTELFNSINGIVFPGGSASLTDSGYERAGRQLFSLSIKANADGTYFPIFGTCLGFEFLSIIYTNASVLSSCLANNISLSLDFQPGYNTSRLFSNTSSEMLRILNKDNVTANSHHFCVSLADYFAYNMSSSFRVLATTTSPDGDVFVSVAEALHYPIYGVQFHPEKSNFEWLATLAFSHTYDAVLVSQYFANFIVRESRKNTHHFADLKKEQDSLIYNWNPVYTKKSVFNQMYIF